MAIDLEALRAVALEEAEELLQEVERCALDLDTRPGDLALVEEMFRAAHTLKGNASCVGFSRITALAHEVESLFAGVTARQRPVDKEFAALALTAVDLLRRRFHARDPETPDGSREEEALVARITVWLEAIGAPEQSLAPAHAPSRLPTLGKRTLRVDVERLDQLLDLVGEVAIAIGKLGTALEGSNRDAQASSLETVRGLFKGVQEGVMRVRLVPLGPTFERFRRATRDLGQASDKHVELVVDGADVEVDMALADALRDPLAHMLRNAIDHGIETPAERAAVGKPPMGRVKLSARHEGNNVVVEVEDDGRGMDATKLLARAKALGVAPQANGDDSVYGLAFTPGLSTATAITSLSGRGIGMDVVRRSVESLRGSVGVTSRTGRGVTVSLRMPLTLALIQGFGVRVGDETYILPLDSILECVHLDTDRAMPSELGGVLEVRGRPLPYLDLGRRFGTKNRESERHAVVVLEHAGVRAGLEVDALVGEIQTVIKPLGSPLAEQTVASGSAVLPDGRVALVLDVGSLLRSITASAAASVES
jgi:two-component system, chemotaxis family, sensor kinase CheA